MCQNITPHKFLVSPPLCITMSYFNLKTNTDTSGKLDSEHAMRRRRSSRLTWKYAEQFEYLTSAKIRSTFFWFENVYFGIALSQEVLGGLLV
jgi:hypothetical protein